jgi:hypothetical protein
MKVRDIALSIPCVAIVERNMCYLSDCDPYINEFLSFHLFLLRRRSSLVCNFFSFPRRFFGLGLEETVFLFDAIMEMGKNWMNSI